MFSLITSASTGSVCSWTRGSGLTSGTSSLGTGQQGNHPTVYFLVTVLPWQQMTLGNGLTTAAAFSILSSAMEVSFFNSLTMKLH